MDSAAVDPDVLAAVEEVSFSFGFRKVLENVTLEIHKGDFLAVLGPNGSGKTTLIKIILGLIKPDRGRVYLLGRPADEFKDWSKIGYVPQKATHFDPLFPASAYEVVAMALRSLPGGRSSRKEEDAAIRSALSLVGMEEHRNRTIGRLSGGQQQRIFIARAIVSRPRMLFLDEPTAGVDGGTQEHFYDLLGALNHSEGITIVLVTHDIGIVNKHVTQVACLNEHLIYHGTHADFCGSEAFQEMVGGHHIVSHRH